MISLILVIKTEMNHSTHTNPINHSFDNGCRAGWSRKEGLQTGNLWRWNCDYRSDSCYSAGIFISCSKLFQLLLGSSVAKNLISGFSKLTLGLLMKRSFSRVVFPDWCGPITAMALNIEASLSSLDDANQGIILQVFQLAILSKSILYLFPDSILHKWPGAWF